jgi:hypothetical protein
MSLSCLVDRTRALESRKNGITKKQQCVILRTMTLSWRWRFKSWSSVLWRSRLLPPSSTRSWSQQGPRKYWYPVTLFHGVITWRWRQHGPSKRCYSATSLHSITTWRWRQQGHPKRKHPATSLHSITTWRWRQHGPPKRWYATTSLRGVTTQEEHPMGLWDC